MSGDVNKTFCAPLLISVVLASAWLGFMMGIFFDEFEPLVGFIGIPIVTVILFPIIRKLDFENIARNDPSNNLDALNAALERDPHNIKKLANRATVYREMGEYERELADIDTVLNLTLSDKQRFEFLRVRYSNRMLAGQVEDAVEIATQAIEIGPRLEKGYAMVSRAVAYIHLEKYDRAIDDLSEAYRKLPGGTKHLAQYHTGMICVLKGDYAKAMEYFVSIGKKYPKEYMAYCGVSVVQFATGDREQAIMNWRRLWKRGDPVMDVDHFVKTAHTPPEFLAKMQEIIDAVKAQESAN